MQVWAKLEDHHAEKITIDNEADIDDLKEEIFKGTQEHKRNFCVFFKQSELKPSAKIPLGATCDEPIMVKRKQQIGYIVSTSSLPATKTDVNSRVNESNDVNDNTDLPPAYDTLRRSTSEMSVPQTNHDTQEKKSTRDHLKEAGERKIAYNHSDGISQMAEQHPALNSKVKPENVEDLHDRNDSLKITNSSLHSSSTLNFIEKESGKRASSKDSYPPTDSSGALSPACNKEDSTIHIQVRPTAENRAIHLPANQKVKVLEHVDQDNAEYENISSCVRTKRYQLADFIQAGELMYVNKTLKNIFEDIITKYQRHRNFSQLVYDCLTPMMYLLKRQQNLTNFMRTLFKLGRSLKLEKSLSIPMSKLSLRMLIDILLLNSDELVSRTVLSLLSKQNPVPFLNPTKHKTRMDAGVFYLWNFNYPTVLSFGVGSCTGKSSLLNQLFMSSFEQHINSIYFRSTMDIDFGYHFTTKRPLNVVDTHGQPKIDTIKKLEVLFDGFIVQVTHSYLQENPEELFKFLTSLSNQKLRIIIVRDVPEDIDMNDNENFPESLIRFSKCHLPDLRNQDIKESESLVENLRDVIFNNIRTSSHMSNCWEQCPMKRRYNKQRQIESLVDESSALALKKSTSAIAEIKMDLVEVQQLAAKERSERTKESQQHYNLQIILQSYYPVYILFIEYCSLMQQLTKINFYGEQSDKIFQIQKDAFAKKQQLEKVKHDECGYIFQDFIKLLEESGALMLKELDILSSELKIEKRLLVSENLLAGDLSVENALSIEVLWRNAILCYKYQQQKKQEVIRKSYYKYIEAGFPFEIVDGDNFCLQHEFLSLVLSDFKNKKVLVISIIGPQNSGKSTLLNYMFGTLFDVRDGRCTRGIYGSLVKSNSSDFEYIMLIDTEGLFSGEKEDLEYDRRIVLFCLAVSHLVIINIKGELDSTMNKMIALCANSLQNIGVNRVPEPVVHFVLNQRAFVLDIKTHDIVIDNILENLKKEGLHNVIKITMDNFHKLPTAYIPESLNLSSKDLKPNPCVARSIPDYLEHAQLLCGKLMNSATECFSKCMAHFSDPPQWLTFSNTIFDVLLKFPDLTYFVDIHEKRQDSTIRERIREAMERTLTVKQRNVIVDETRNLTEKQLDEHIERYFSELSVELRSTLDRILKDHQASQTIRKRAYEFLNTQHTGFKNAWKVTALQENDRLKTVNLRHTGGEQIRKLVDDIIDSGKTYDKTNAENEFERMWTSMLDGVKSKFNEHERLRMSIKYIYPNYHSFEAKNLPASDHIVKTVGDIKDLSDLGLNALKETLKSVFIQEVSKHASIEEHQTVYNSLPEYSFQTIRSLKYLNDDLLCEFLSDAGLSQTCSSGRDPHAHSSYATIPVSTYDSKHDKQSAIFSRDTIKRFLKYIGFGSSNKSEKHTYQQRAGYNSHSVVLSPPNFQKYVTKQLVKECVYDPSPKILPLLNIFDYVYQVIENVLFENGTGAVRIEIEIIQKLVSILNTFLKEINSDLNLFNASLSKHVASAFHTIHVILLAKLYFKEQKDHFVQQIEELEVMKPGLQSYFLRMVVPNIEMDNNFAESSTKQIAANLRSTLKREADTIIENKLKENEKKLSRKSLQELLDKCVIGHHGGTDDEIINRHIDYIMKPVKVIENTFENVWKQIQNEIEQLIEDKRNNISNTFDCYISSLKQIKNGLSEKGFKSGVQLIDNLFDTQTGEVNKNLINKGKCMASVLYDYLSGRTIKDKYKVAGTEYILNSVDRFQLLVPPEQCIKYIMNTEQMRKEYEQCSINDVFQFIDKLIEFGSAEKQQFQSLRIDFINTDSHDRKREFLFKARGCPVPCPCCNRLCDVDHTLLMSLPGSKFNEHNCQTGHQYRCMGGTKLEYTNEASIKMCEDMKDDDIIVTSTERLMWKQFKNKNKEWNYGTIHISSAELEELRMKYATIWGIIGEKLCGNKDYYPDMVFVESNVDPTKHFILLLDNSGSMRASQTDNRWSTLMNAVEKFLIIRKSSKTMDTISIILFGKSATIVCSSEDIRSFDVMSKIREKENTVGSGTDFSQPISLIKETIDTANRKKTSKSLVHSVIFLSDGEARYPEKELKKLKADCGSVIAKFWSMGLGHSKFEVLERINQEMNGTFINVAELKDLVTAYAEVASHNLSISSR